MMNLLVKTGSIRSDLPNEDSIDQVIILFRQAAHRVDRAVIRITAPRHLTNQEIKFLKTLTVSAYVSIYTDSVNDEAPPREFTTFSVASSFRESIVA